MSTNNITVDFDKVVNDSSVSIPLNSADVETLNITLQNNGTSVDITGDTVTLCITRPDNFNVTENISVTDGHTIQCILGSSELSVSGSAIGSIKVVDSNNNLLYAAFFNFIVGNASDLSNLIIPNDVSYSAIKNIIAQISKLDNDFLNLDTQINVGYANLKKPSNGLTPAKGDGSDESSIIQSIINSSNESIIYIPDGTFCFDKIDINRKVLIMGSGKLKIKDNATSGSININANGVIFDNIEIDGNKANSTKGKIYMNTKSNVIIRKCYLHDLKEFAIQCFNVVGCIFDRNFITDIGDQQHDALWSTAGIQFQGTADTCIVHRNILNRPSCFGITFLVTSGSNNEVSNNIVLDSSFIGLGQQLCTNQKIISNTVMHSYDNGVDLQKCNFAQILDNILTDNGLTADWGSGNNLFWGSDTHDVITGVLIKGNIMTKSDTTQYKSLNCFIYANSPDYMTEMSLVENNIFNGGEVGFCNAKRGKFSGNTITSGGLLFGTGIVDLEVFGNTFDKCQAISIRDFINGFSIHDNLFNYCGSNSMPYAIYSWQDTYHAKKDIRVNHNKFIISTTKYGGNLRYGLIKTDAANFPIVQFNDNYIDGANGVDISFLIANSLINVNQDRLEILRNKLQMDTAGGWDPLNSLMDLPLAISTTTTVNFQPLTGYQRVMILALHTDISGGVGYCRVAIFEILKRKQPYFSTTITVNKLLDTDNCFSATTDNASVSITTSINNVNQGLHAIMMEHSDLM